MLKQSKYNRILYVAEDTWWLHNILSGAECLINDQEKNILEIPEQYFVSENKDIVEEWKNMGFLISLNVMEDSCMELERKISMYSSISNQFGVVIAPTMDCNAQCFYCYDNDTRARCYMNSGTEAVLVDYIKNMIPGKKKLFISWFGGEPLLCINSIKRISAQLTKLCDELNIVYDAELTTNGYFLDKILDDFKDLRISDIQVTIDGYGKEYEKRKHFVNSPSAWKRVSDNIFQYSTRGFHITLRMNFDKSNFQSIKEAVKFFINNPMWNDNISIYFYPLEPVEGEAHSNVYFEESEYETAMDELYTYLFELGYYDLHPDAVDFNKLVLPCYCGTLSTNAIDFAGNIYQCQHLLCNPEYVIGNILDGGIKINKKVLEWYDGTLPAKCEDCNVIPLCQGGCITKRKLGQECYLCHMMKYRLNVQEKLRIKQLKNCLIE